MEPGGETKIHVGEMKDPLLSPAFHDSVGETISFLQHCQGGGLEIVDAYDIKILSASN